MQGVALLKIAQNAELMWCKIKFPTTKKCKAGLTLFLNLPIKQGLINILYPTISSCVVQICIKCYCIFIIEPHKNVCYRRIPNGWGRHPWYISFKERHLIFFRKTFFKCREKGHQNLRHAGLLAVWFPIFISLHFLNVLQGTYYFDNKKQ